MTAYAWNGESRGTRDRILRLLLERDRTVEELAGMLGVTRNAVRAQVGLLQREGSVETKGEVKGSRRPAAVYGLRSGTEIRFSRAYPAVLSTLVGVLARTLDGADYNAVMRELGAQLARREPRPPGEPEARIDAAVEFLRRLGATAEVARSDDGVRITGYGCPIGEAVAVDARTCIAMKALLEEMTGLPVSQQCRHGERPSCRFEIRVPPSKRIARSGKRD